MRAAQFITRLIVIVILVVHVILEFLKVHKKDETL